MRLSRLREDGTTKHGGCVQLSNGNFSGLPSDQTRGNLYFGVQLRA